MSLVLLSFRPDPVELDAFARDRGLLRAGGDLGYALHCLLTAAFGDLAPRPFRNWRPSGDGSGSARLLAYSPRSLAELRQAAESLERLDCLNLLNFDHALERAMPDRFAAGRRLGFEVRIRPIQRTGAARDGSHPAVERDVFLARGGADSDRVQLYGDWLARQLARQDAARLEAVRLEQFCISRLLSPNRSAGQTGMRAVPGPDALLSGVLRIQNEAAFAGLTANGVGRFRALGFGMLLLRASPAEHSQDRSELAST